MTKIFLLFLLLSCAIKHHVQVGDIERLPEKKLKPFQVIISETGVNLKESAKVVGAVTKDNGRAEEIQNIISLFQMGPRTGNSVYNEKYADAIGNLILKKCPSGKVTGLLMVRETNKYPVVSGEIVKIDGYCIL